MAGVQSIVTLVAIVGAAAWALYTFWRLGTINRARAEITALERSAMEQPVLQIDVGMKPASQTATTHRHLAVTAKFRNDGKRTVVFQAPTLIVSRVAPGKDERLADGHVERLTARLLNEQGTLEPMPTRVLRAGQARTVAFFVSLPSPGHYLLQLKAIYYGAELRDGKFQQSADEPVEAIEQAVIEVQ
ncbi:MAG: hypothetical protein IH983_08810 [Planctomycetes bacterium]|nr:hypothetical protein [Planctomycetota bacterium]